MTDLVIYFNRVKRPSHLKPRVKPSGGYTHPGKHESELVQVERSMRRMSQNLGQKRLFRGLYDVRKVLTVLDRCKVRGERRIRHRRFPEIKSYRPKGETEHEIVITDQ